MLPLRWQKQPGNEFEDPAAWAGQGAGLPFLNLIHPVSTEDAEQLGLTMTDG